MLKPAELIPAAWRVRALALVAGVLEPIETSREVVREAGVDFEVRVADSIRRRRAFTRRAPGNPFLPPEPALTVGPISGSHRVVLNRFPVLDDHLLLITTGFVDQQAPLEDTDFAAASTGLQAVDGLVFYNAGPTAGASQAHRHLQLIPPLSPGAIAPIEAAFRFGSRTSDVAAFPFAHRLCSVDGTDPVALGAATRRALEELRVTEHGAAYNLLATRHWVLVVPRLAEYAGSISVNSLGFAGSFFVSRPERAVELRESGLLAALGSVTRPVAARR